MVVTSAIEGPLPVDRFEGTAADISESSDDPISQSTGQALRAALALAVGDDSAFREHERRWRGIINRNGLSGLGATQALGVAYLEILAGSPQAGERRLREAREILAPLGFIWWLDSLDAYLCAAVAAQDRPRDFLHLANAFEASVTLLDRDISVRRHLVRAQAHLLRGSAADAEVAVRRALDLAEASDLVFVHADALFTLADILDVRDRGGDAAAARSEAIAKLRANGNLPAVARLGG